MIREFLTDTAFTYENQPDGGRTTMIDPYDGCQLRCPYCFQAEDENWNQDLYVKTNIAKKLAEELPGRSRSEALYFGSRCDPYMPVESDFRLTRKCLEVLRPAGHPVFICSKADNGLILQDIELFKTFRPPLTVLLGLSHIRQAGKGGRNQNIATANLLHQSGVAVWAFITPVLPYIMDVDAMIGALDPDIPVFLDKLRVFEKGNQADRVARMVHERFPQFDEVYSRILRDGDERYWEELKIRYCGNPRVRCVFG